MLIRACWAALVLLITFAMEPAMAAKPDDKPRDLDTHHLFTPPADRHTWEKRRAELRRQVLFSAGLWPMPEKTELNPIITGKIDGDGYTIENVALETRPHFFLCGNLYRPKGKKGPFPGIVNPHGHWSHGRLEMQPDVPKADPNGPMGDGRGNLVAIGVNLARQGFVVFAYDAVGYNDTSQVDHNFAKSLRAWSYGVSELGLQLWDSIRVVDYLQSLRDVDKNRIGCTGASGGGSQTFLLTAVDDRVKVSVPVNMVSAYMQGGCLCENGPGLRVGTDNPEIAAIMAPRPMLLVAATGDWTKNNPSEEWPTIKKIYGLYGAGDKTSVKQFNYQHNYNIESREAMYAWFGKWLLNDPDSELFGEKPFTADVAKMHVWTEKTPMPASALKEPELTSAMMDEGRSRVLSAGIDAILSDPKEQNEFRSVYQPALALALSAAYPMDKQHQSRSKHARALLVVSTPDNKAAAEQVIAAAISRYSEARTLELPAVRESEADLWKAYYSTYNRTPLGDRVQRVLDEMSALEASGHPVVDVVGLGEAGAWALFAKALAPPRLAAGRAVIDVAGIDPGDDSPFVGPLYAPGIRRAGDFISATALCASSQLTLFDVNPRTPENWLAAMKTLSERGGGTFEALSGSLGAAEIAARLAR